MRAAYGLGDQGRLHASTAPAAWGEQLMDDMLATPNASLAGFLPGHIEDTLQSNRWQLHKDDQQSKVSV